MSARDIHPGIQLIHDGDVPLSEEGRGFLVLPIEGLTTYTETCNLDYFVKSTFECVDLDFRKVSHTVKQFNGKAQLVVPMLTTSRKSDVVYVFLYPAGSEKHARSPGFLEKHGKMLTVIVQFSKEFSLPLPGVRASDEVVAPRQTLSELSCTQRSVTPIPTEDPESPASAIQNLRDELVAFVNNYCMRLDAALEALKAHE